MTLAQRTNGPSLPRSRPSTWIKDYGEGRYPVPPKSDFGMQPFKLHEPVVSPDGPGKVAAMTQTHEGWRYRIKPMEVGIGPAWQRNSKPVARGAKRLLHATHRAAEERRAVGRRPDWWRQASFVGRAREPVAPGPRRPSWPRGRKKGSRAPPRAKASCPMYVAIAASWKRGRKRGRGPASAGPLQFGSNMTPDRLAPPNQAIEWCP
jgi:hypothetical protein